MGHLNYEPCTLLQDPKMPNCASARYSVWHPLGRHQYWSSSRNGTKRSQERTIVVELTSSQFGSPITSRPPAILPQNLQSAGHRNARGPRQRAACLPAARSPDTHHVDAACERSMRAMACDRVVGEAVAPSTRTPTPASESPPTPRGHAGVEFLPLYAKHHPQIAVG